MKTSPKNGNKITAASNPLIYPLDNMALIYPAIITHKQPMLFRLSATLSERINASRLQMALENILPRFPIMRTTIQHGLFWSYLKENFERPQLCSDFMMSFNYNVNKSGNYPFRLKAYNCRIALETSHLVTDGKGAIEFFRAILAEYFTQLGKEFKNYGDIIRPTTPFNTEEIEDLFQKKLADYGSQLPALRKGSAFREVAPSEPPPFLKVKQFTLPLDEVLDASHRYGVSLTELLVTLYTAAYQDRMFLLPPSARYRKAIRITTPANLRSIMASNTLRNFIGLVNMEIDPRLGVYSFKEILNDVHHSLRKELVAKRFLPFISRNIRSERHLLAAGIPLALKKPVLRRLHRTIMQQETSVLSNLGPINFPPEMAELIESVDFIPAAKPINRRDCGVISYKNQLTINFCRTCENDEVERYFYDHLCEQGLIPKVREFSNTVN
ncbi:MAG: hypothetical protein FWE37_04085 [Spirochaetaceae bacterium]|nr:hypothetical protein [Spirochaetaceae bacterium]